MFDDEPARELDNAVIWLKKETMHTWIIALSLGVGTGIISGLFGIGGGIVLIPALVFLLKFPQKAASGITLVALLLPVGALGVYQYYKSGLITVDHIKIGLMLGLGIFIGAFFGAKLTGQLSEALYSKLFAVLLGVLAIKFWLK